MSNAARFEPGHSARYLAGWILCRSRRLRALHARRQTASDSTPTLVLTIEWRMTLDHTIHKILHSVKHCTGIGVIRGAEESPAFVQASKEGAHGVLEAIDDRIRRYAVDRSAQHALASFGRR